MKAIRIGYVRVATEGQGCSGAPLEIYKDIMRGAESGV
jgi:hypothetical protein